MRAGGVAVEDITSGSGATAKNNSMVSIGTFAMSRPCVCYSISRHCF